MSRDHKIIAATLPCRGDSAGGEAKFRFVIVAWFYPGNEGAFDPAWNLIKEYSTHMDILPGQKGFTDGLNDGHYHQRWEDAFTEFAERVTRHNMAFRDGNVSHIPGIDYIDCRCDLHDDTDFDNIIDADREYPVQERAEKQRRKLSKEGKGKYIEGS